MTRRIRIRKLRRAPRERGVAVITALLLTTLAVTIVASLFWQQQVQVRSMENQRLHLQTKWILRGALDWAMLVLRQDGYDHRNYTSLDAVWATPLAETRLDQYIERERVQGEQFDATLSGNITDACSRYNLRNLAEGGVVDPQALTVFKQLLQNLRIDKGLALRAANFVAAGQPFDPSAAANGQQTGGQQTGDNPQQQTPAPVRSPTGGLPLKLLQVDDLLAVPGFTPAIVERLRPFVIVLPMGNTTVNVNTAPPEVLASLVPNMSVGEASALVAKRKQAPWRDMPYFMNELNGRQPTAGAAEVKSEWFLVDSRIRLDRAALDAEALVHRPLSFGQGGGTTVEWIRQY
jgi:general secretion pathway protein K